jgi:hypothetical protein
MHEAAVQKGEEMMAQATMAKGTPSNFKDGGAAPAHLPLISSLASLEQFFAGLGAPVNEPANPPDLAQGKAVSKKPQLELLAPLEIGPYR